MATPIPDLWTILSESKRIINADRRHFLTLSLIFVLPLSFSSLLYLVLFQIFNTNPHPPSTPTHQPINPNITLLLFSLLHSLFVLVFSFCTVSSITYSVFHSFYGQPVDHVTAIKSILTSFLPLLSTAIVSRVIISFILLLFGLLFGLLLFLIIFGFRLLGISIPYYSPHFLGSLVALALLFVMLYLEVRWSLVSAIVVVESRWGLEPLRRSASLIKGMKGVAVSCLFIFWFLEGILVWCISAFTKASYGITSDWVSVVQILLIIAVNSIFLTMLQLYKTAANTVLYIYCKAIHNEKFGSDYVSYVGLPFDEGKVPHVASDIHVQSI